MARPRRVGPEDQLTLVEHLEELRTRLIIVLSALAIAMTGCYIENVRIYHFLQRPLDGHVKLVTLAPTEAFFNAIMEQHAASRRRRPADRLDEHRRGRDGA